MKTLSDYRAHYAAGHSITDTIRGLWEEVRDLDDDGIFIAKTPWKLVAEQLDRVENGGTLPLAGIPFVVKDNIDVAGLPTTAGCPDYAYLPGENAPVVTLLEAAGAVCLGKTNLDQFATGLVGVRTPYPIPKNPFDAEYLPGGSSCGSAVAVARGLAVFSLGTDTAGSGRVPAAFNELVGVKPTRGGISTRGVVDACKALDCVSIFAQNCGDAAEVLEVAAQDDPEEPFSRTVKRPWARFPAKFRFGFPKLSTEAFFGWDDCQNLFEQAAQRLEAVGGERVLVDLGPFLTAARLLYEGPWVTERFVAIEDFLKEKPDSIFPVTRKIIEGGEAPKASALFKAQYQLAACKKAGDDILEEVDFIMLPTTPRNYTVAEVEADPVALNSILGTYTNFMNLLDYSALAVPAGRHEENGKSLPWGVTFFAPAHRDLALMEVGDAFEKEEPLGQGTLSQKVAWDEVSVVVCGAHLSGMALNHQLTNLGAKLSWQGTTAPGYRLFVLPAEPDDGIPPRPALVADEEVTSTLEVEVWNLTQKAFGQFVAMIPRPLGIGKVALSDGRTLPGFIAEAGLDLQQEITELGSWRRFVEG